MKGLTVFCDFDGPIVDVSARYYSTYRLVLEELQAEERLQGRSLHLQPMTKEQFWTLKRNRVPDVEIAQRSGIKPQAIEWFLERVKDSVNQPERLHEDRLQPGVDWALNLLHSRGARLILVTLRCQRQVTNLLNEYGLAPLFTDIYGTQDIDAAYLNVIEWKTRLMQAAWHEHLCRYGRPLQSWMIGDTEADIVAGQSVGMPVIAVNCGIRSHTYLQAYRPTYICEDLLAAAHQLARDWGYIPRHEYQYARSSRSIA